MILTISKIKKSLKSIALAATLLLPLSCFNNVEPAVPFLPPVFPGEYGIYATLAGESPRTAIPTWPASPEYYVEYSTLSDWNDVTKHIIKTPASDPSIFNVDAGGNVRNFYLPLSNDTWVVEAGVKNGGVKQLTAKKTIPLTPEESVVNESFFLQMPVTANGKGSIELKVEAESGSGINFIEMLIQCGDGTSITAGRSGNTFSATNIPNGKQKIVINAYASADNSGRQIFSTIQDVIIYAGLTTNQWLINGSVPSGNKYTITSQMVTDFIPFQYYVDSVNGLDSNSGTTKKYPFQTIYKAISVIHERSETREFTIHVKDGSSFENSTQTLLRKSIKIECWKNVPNDRLGAATWTRSSGSPGTAIQIGNASEQVKLTIVSANETCGLTINGGGNSDLTCIRVFNGEFIMDGGKITGFGTSSTNVGAVNLADDPASGLKRVFTMRKGQISENRARKAPGVYVGSGTSFFMEGGKIINNTSVDFGDSPSAVKVAGTMYVSGLVQIGGTDSTDNKFEANGRNANLYLCSDKKLIISGSLAAGSHIGLAVDFGSNIPSTTNQFAVTQNYTNNEAPSTFFNYDGTEAFVFVRSTKTGSVGEAALIRGGGKIMSARDLNVSFTISDDDINPNNNQSLSVNGSKQITITPVVSYGGQHLYFNTTTQCLYWDSAYSNEFSSNVMVSWTTSMSMYGTDLSDAYQPISPNGYSANTFNIPGLPYPGTYTLTVVITYMGIKYSANFDFVCTSS